MVLTNNIFYRQSYGILLRWCQCDVRKKIRSGNKNGTKISKYLLWHCLADRIHLSLDDAIKHVKEVNYFKHFLDKLFVCYHTPNKHQRELNTVAKELGTEVLKIWRIFRYRLTACSDRTVKAVCKSYQALTVTLIITMKQAGILIKKMKTF